jgi:hypothetical protein
MKEIIFLSFGNTSNYVNTHFWNLNDEISKLEDNFQLNQSMIYNDYGYPRSLLFDYAENIRPYFVENEQIAKKAKEEEDLYLGYEKSEENGKGSDFKINKMLNFDFSLEENKFLDLLNDCSVTGQTGDEEEVNTNLNSYNKQPLPQEIYKLPDDQIYDYLQFQKTIKNWNDFLQPRFSKNTLNDIKMADVEYASRSSYIKGYDFFTNENFSYLYYENFENNFRKFLEDCDRLEFLNITLDFNSFFGGVGSKMIESFHDEIPKIMKVYQGIDDHSSFFSSVNGQSVLNREKVINYLWFFTDLYQEGKENSLFLPVLKKQNPSVIKKLFSIDAENKNYESVYDYFYTSLLGLNLQNFYIPARSKLYGKPSNILSLIHNSSSLNFIETDCNISLPTMSKYFDHVEKVSYKNNGILFNFSRTLTDTKFSWKNSFENSYRFNKFNSVVMHGYKDSLIFLNDKIDSTLMKLSGFNYTDITHMKLPLCFPRKIYVPDINQTNLQQPQKMKEVFLEDMSVMCIYRPFSEYPQKYLNNIPNYIKNNSSDFRKYFTLFDPSKYLEMRDKIETFHSLLEIYQEFNENHGIYLNESEEEDDD